MAENDSLISRLAEFYRNLYNYQSYRIVKKAKGLSEKQYREMMDLREWLVQEYGALGTFITETTGIETVPIVIGDKEYPTHIWTVGLLADPVKRTPTALGICIDTVNQAIGKLKNDIERGVRDSQGNLIEKLQKFSLEAPKAFVSHGKESVALNKLEEFLHTLGITPLIVKEQPSLDKTVDDKVDYYLGQADFVIVLATGDDEIEGKLHPRQNVIHEIGLAQKTHAGKIIYLLEEGTEFPSNISPKVWERFKQRNMIKAFLCILRELRALGILRLEKP